MSLFFTKEEKAAIYEKIAAGDVKTLELAAARAQSDRAIDTQHREALSGRVSGLASELAALRAEVFGALKEDILKEAAAQFEAQKEAEIKAKYDSDEPYVNIISSDFTQEGGIQLRLDWNNAFIKYLKANGFVGTSDEAIVDRWVSSLSNERPTESGPSDFK